MGFIGDVLGYPLGWIMWVLYNGVKNYGVAILLFTIITKAMLIPVSIKQQKSSMIMAAFQPKIAALQKKFGNNKEKLQEAQMKLYSEEGYNPMSSCGPMIVPLILVYGMIDVVYKPMTHILRISKDIIKSASTTAFNVITAAQGTGAPWATAIEGYTKSADKFANSYQNQLFIMQAYQHNPQAFGNLDGFSDKIGSFNMSLFGIIDLGATPNWALPLILIPIFAAVTQLIMTVYSQMHQKKINPAAPSMGLMNVMLYGMPLFSGYIAFSLPAGVGFYWICQSVISFVQMIILNRIYTPEKVAVLVEKDKKKNKGKKKKDSYMQRMQKVMQEQKALETEKKGTPVVSDEDGNVKVSKSTKKEYESKVIADKRNAMNEKYRETDELDKDPAIAEARKRMAEKYGDKE